MKCVLHIGTEKTATSLLQEWLYANKQTLKARGIHLTNSFGTPNNRYIPAFFCLGDDDFFLHHRLSTEQDKRVFFKKFKQDFAKEVSRAESAHTVLLTSEHFHSRLLQQAEVSALKAFLDEHFEQTELVCYFREQADMALSFYSTQLRGNGQRDVDEVMAHVTPSIHYYNFLSIADLWSSAFGRENCRFRIYDKSRFRHGDIRMDFLDAISEVDLSDDLEFASDTKNESLSGLQAIVFREINRIVPYWHETHGMNPRNLDLKQRILQLPSLKRGKIHSKEVLRVSDRFAESNRRFFEFYLPTERGFERSSHAREAHSDLTKEELAEALRCVSETLLLECAGREDDQKPGPTFRARIDRWRQVLDYRVHKWLSETSLVTPSVRKKFRGPAERRRRSLAPGRRI